MSRSLSLVALFAVFAVALARPMTLTTYTDKTCGAEDKVIKLTTDECVDIDYGGAKSAIAAYEGDNAAIATFTKAGCPLTSAATALIGKIGECTAVGPISYKITLGLSGGAIAGIVIGIVAAIAIGVSIFAWKKKMWCFKPKAGSPVTTKMDGVTVTNPATA